MPSRRSRRHRRRQVARKTAAAFLRDEWNEWNPRFVRLSVHLSVEDVRALFPLFPSDGETSPILDAKDP